MPALRAGVRAKLQVRAEAALDELGALLGILPRVG